MRDLAGERDPSRNPNFSRRWTEPLPCEGFKTIGEMSAKIVAHLPFQRKIERLHSRGPRVLGEMLAELGAERSIMTIIDRKIDAYTEINPEALRATAGEKFWPVPVHVVRREP